jgi:hypothetical protein
MNYLNSFWNIINELLHGINGNLILTLSILVITGFFIFFIKNFYKKIKHVKDDLLNANKLFDFNENHRDKFYNSFDTINKSLIENLTFSHSWHEFKEHIIYPSDSDIQSGIATKFVIKNSIQPDFFFNDECIIEDKIDLRFIDSIPGKLTGLGILGTFVGLTIGIAGATHALGSLESSNSENLTSTLITLLQGASLAFVTSVLGISFSMIFSVLEKREINNLKKSLRTFVDNLEKSLKLITNEQIVLELHESIKEQNKKFDGFSNDLAIALENALNKTLKDPFQDGIGQLLGGLASIRDVQQNFSNNLMSELVNKVSGNISTHAQENQMKASKAFEDLQDAFSRQAAEMVASQNSMAATSRQLLNEISETSKSNQDNMNKQLTDTISSLKDVLNTVNSTFKENIISSSTEIKKVLGETFDSVANDLQSRQKDLKNEYNNSTETLAKVINMANEVVQNGAKVIQSSTVNINKNDSILSSIYTVVQEQQKTVQLLDTCSAKINSSSNLFDKASNNLVSASSLIENSARGIGESNTKTLQVWEEYRQRFENVDKSLSVTFKEFVLGAETYQVAVTTHVKDLTKEYEKAISQLAGQLDELSDIFEKDPKKK